MTGVYTLALAKTRNYGMVICVPALRRGTAMKTIALALLSAAAWAQAGHWQGTIKMGENRNLPITVDLAKNADGSWIGSMSVTGSTSVDVPATVTVNGAAVRFVANLPQRATFEGKLSDDGATITGTAGNADGDTSFQLTRSGDPNVKLPPASTPLPKEFEGQWEGSIDAGGTVRKVGLKLVNGADGKGTAVLIAGEQHMEIPAATVTAKGKELTLDVRAVSGSYRGTLGDNGEIAGEWTQGPTHAPVTFKKVK
jgi:hypothetical protein